MTPPDRAVQRVLVGGLTSLFGADLAVYAEEDDLDDPAALTEPLWAVIDPIGQITGWVDVPAMGLRLFADPTMGFTATASPSVRYRCPQPDHGHGHRLELPMLA